MNSSETRVYFADPRLSLTRVGRFVIRVISAIVPLVLTVIALTMLLSDLGWL